MDFEAVLFADNQTKLNDQPNITTSIDWLLNQGFEKYVKHFSDQNHPINLLEVLKHNRFLNGNELLTLFSHVENLNNFFSTKEKKICRPLSTYNSPNPSSFVDNKMTRERWSCHLSRVSKRNLLSAAESYSPLAGGRRNLQDRLHTFKSVTFRQISNRTSQIQTGFKNLHNRNKINYSFERETDSKSSGNSIDELKNIIGCTKHRSLTTVREQSVNDELSECANQNHSISEHISHFISSFSNSNSFSSLDSKTRSQHINNKDLSPIHLRFYPTKVYGQSLPRSNMKSDYLSNTVPQISVASNQSETSQLSPCSTVKSTDSDYLLPTDNNVNLRVIGDIPRSTGSNRRYFNSWGYEFEIDSGVEELSNDSIDMGESGRINFRTGSFMTRYRRNSKYNNNQTSPRSDLTSPSQHCMNWAWCKDESCHSMVDNVEDELNPVLDSLFSDIDSLDNFRNILQTRRISSNLEEKNIKTNNRPKDFNIRKTSHKKDQLDVTKNIEDKEDLEILNEQNNFTLRPSTDNKLKKSSLKKSLSARKRNHPFRWSSLARTNQPINPCKDIELSHLSLNQFLTLKKLAMRRLTSLLEVSIPSQKSQFNWKFPKLLSQKSKFLESSTNVFGSSLTYWQSKIGQPLPPVIYHALKYIRQVGPELDGIFRRAGGKARITELKKEIEKNPEITDFGKWQAYDVADMIKSYFRSLPECLMTNKFSNTLISIKTYIPEQNWFEAIQWVIIKMPDENRLVLQSLLYFLADLTKHSKTTQMTSYNLAVCLSPSLFHSPHLINSTSISPMRMRKSIHGPDPRDLEDQKATHHCLKFMIDHAASLFRLSEDTISKVHIQLEFERTISLSKLLQDCNDWFNWIRSRVDNLMNEYNHKFKNWTSLRKEILKIHSDKSDIYHGFELFYKKNPPSSDKSNEGLNTVGTWRITAEIDASAAFLLDKIQYKRHEWDPEIGVMHIKREISDSVDICYMEVASNPPQSKRQMNLIRGCQRNIDGNTNVLVTQSVDDNLPAIDKKPLKHLSLDDQETDTEKNIINVIQDDVIIEYFPNSQKSRINWLSRIDLKGHSTEWYLRQWSHVLIRRMIHLKIACAQIKI